MAFTAILNRDISENFIRPEDDEDLAFDTMNGFNFGPDVAYCQSFIWRILRIVFVFALSQLNLEQDSTAGQQSFNQLRKGRQYLLLLVSGRLGVRMSS